MRTGPRSDRGRDTVGSLAFWCPIFILLYHGVEKEVYSHQSPRATCPVTPSHRRVMFPVASGEGGPGGDEEPWEPYGFRVCNRRSGSRSRWPLVRHWILKGWFGL